MDNFVFRKGHIDKNFHSILAYQARNSSYVCQVERTNCSWDHQARV